MVLGHTLVFRLWPDVVLSLMFQDQHEVEFHIWALSHFCVVSNRLEQLDLSRCCYSHNSACFSSPSFPCLDCHAVSQLCVTCTSVSTKHVFLDTYNFLSLKKFNSLTLNFKIVGSWVCLYLLHIIDNAR